MFNPAFASDRDDLRTPEGKRIYVTQRLASKPPQIDGRLDEECWKEGYWSSHYEQFMPVEGAAPSQQTELKILYDDKNIYVGIRAYDTEPEKIDRQRGRRDAFEGDIVGVCFDSYFDHRTGFEFDLTAAGSKIDLILGNNGWDTTWDAVWYGEVAMTSFGWSAEMRIPLNQLRYGDSETQVWGLHAWRWFNRNNEEDQWNMIGRNNPGQLYSIGELHGIEDLPKSRHIELLPYTVGRVTTTGPATPDQGRKTDRAGALGLDGKVGLTSAFTLDFTVNPDFGQVEADPAVLNISAFETFYEEKRPFFLEGKNIFNFGAGEDLLFYSRRVGQAPSYVPTVEAGQEIDSPASTSILGALKLTGKTEGGLSVGVMESLTGEETARILWPGGSRDQTVEPMANYTVARVQKDFNRSNTILGAMVTSVHRSIQDPELDFLAGDALTGGVDFRHHWKNKTYYLDVKTLFSDVRGSREAILNLQESSARYYQRPDATHVTLDPTRTRLGGYGGEVEVGKGANGDWRFSQEVSWRSPGLELNDMGYLRVADQVSDETSVAYVMSRPSGIFREYTLSAEQQNNWDFGGEFLGSSASVGASVLFANKWKASVDLTRLGSSLDTRLLRGGSAVKIKGFWSGSYYVSSDVSRPFSAEFQYHAHRYDDRQSGFHGIYPGIRYRITDPLLLSAHLDYSLNKDIFQYVAQTELSGQRRDLVAQIDQKTLGLTFRVDYAVTPELTIQYYGNPYVSTGLYSDFKRFTNPRSNDYAELYHTFTGPEIAYDPATRIYQFDETLDGVPDYSIENPDFNFREFRSNLVARWEYKPGSVLYLVWTQGRSVFDYVTNESLGHSFGRLFSSPAENVFMVKFSYWLPM